jgi:hypothetical protein
MLHDIRGPAILAAELLALDQDELVKKVRQSHDEPRASLILLGRAAERDRPHSADHQGGGNHFDHGAGHRGM